MIKKIFAGLLLSASFHLQVQAQVTSTETFETETSGSTSFADNSQVFNITSQSHGPFDIQAAYPGTGWDGTVADNRYIDNDGFAVAGQGTGFTISSLGSVPFNIKSVWMYLADNTANVNVSGTLTIVGNLGGVGQFTLTSTSGFNNTSLGVNNGYTLIDFTTFGGSDHSTVNIDQLVFTTTSSFNYVALDAFKWSTVCPTVTVSPVSQTNVACNGGSNGAASVSASGGSGFTYNWTPGNPTGDGTASVTGLTAGNWTCTATNSCGNSSSTTFTVTQPSALAVIPVSQTNVACNGGSNGAASVSVSGGTTSYSYNWAPGNPTGDGTASVTGLTANTWTCTVTDANACTATRTFTVTQPSALAVIPVSQTNVSCNGGSNGAASVSVSGGTGAYSYNWAPGNPTGDGTSSVTGLTSGVWTCTVTDANSCTSTATVNIGQPTALVLTVASQTNVSTFGGSDGAASVNSASGGTAGYTYNWTPGNPTGDGTTSVSGLTANTWTCTVSDANSCTASQTFTITQPAAGPAEALNFDGNDDAVTIADNSSLDISQQITLEAWVYAAPGGNSIQNVICKSNCTSNNNGYIFPRTDDGWNNFIAYFSINGNWQTLSAPYAGLNQWHHLAATYDGSYIRLYQDGVLAATSSLITGSIQLNSNPLSIGTQPGCGEFFKGNLDEARAWNRALCQGEIQNNMNGELKMPQSGLMAYYRFNEGAASANNAGINTVADSSGNANNGTLQNFALNGASSNWIAPGGVTSGNYASAYVVPTLTVSGTTTICSGQSTVLSASGADTYTWTSGPSTASYTVNPSTDATYSVSGTTSNGCPTILATVPVTVNSVPSVTSLSGNVHLCGDMSATFSITSSGTNTYQWIYESVAPLGFDSAAIDGSYTEVGWNTPTMTIQQVLTGNYDHYAVYCIVTNSLSCSTVSAPDTIYANPNPTVAASVTTPTLCLGFADTLVGTGASTYTWSSNASGVVNDTAIVSPSANDTYTVTGTDNNGCFNTATVSITVNNCGTGLSNQERSNWILYPNPSNGIFTLQVENEIGVVEVYNSLGSLVFKANVKDNKIQIDLSRETSGIYYLNAQGKKMMLSKQ